jgi:acylphosphatase
MTDSYKLSIRGRISRVEFRQILKLFALDLTASQIAQISNLNRNTVNRYLIGSFNDFINLKVKVIKSKA